MTNVKRNRTDVNSPNNNSSVIGGIIRQSSTTSSNGVTSPTATTLATSIGGGVITRSKAKVLRGKMRICLFTKKDS